MNERMNEAVSGKGLVENKGEREEWAVMESGVKYKESR